MPDGPSGTTERFSARETTPNVAVDHIVIAVHGIRTYGGWQDKLKDLVEQGRPNVKVIPYRYGYFSGLAFLIPFLRWIAAYRFRASLNEEIRRHPNARVDVVAHSFGTYLVARALGSLSPQRPIHTLIFAGSVLKESFEWIRYVGPGNAVTRLINECGSQDVVLVFSQIFALFMGKAGRDGFHGIESDADRFANRRFPYGHSGYFDGDFMKDWWVPLLTANDPIVVPPFERQKLPWWRGALKFLLNNAEPFKITTAAGLIFLVVYMPFENHRQKVAFDKVRRYAYLNRLANAALMPSRDPGHVEELLQRDLHDLPETLTIQAEGRSGTTEAALPMSQTGDLEQSWWNYLPFLHDTEKQVFKAMDLHSRANAELAVHDANQIPDMAKAKLLYEQAIDLYQPAKERAPGSYALCLLDYARLLSAQQKHLEAIAYFRRIREEVFPAMDTQAQRSNWSWLGDIWHGLTFHAAAVSDGRNACPRSLKVDALCEEAVVFRNRRDFKKANELLKDAEKVANDNTPDPLLLAQAYNEQAWTALDQLNLNEAGKAFNNGITECNRSNVRDTFVAKRLRYHLLHGQAIAERYEGKAKGARDKFDDIVRQLHTELSEDYRLTPKQRRDLRDRMVNSMQRRADCELFQVGLLDESGATDERSKLAMRAFALYEAAYRWTPADDDDNRLALLNRMYLSRFLAYPTIPDQEAASIYTEAQRTYEKLNAGRRESYELDYMTVQACARFQFAGFDNRPVRYADVLHLAQAFPRRNLLVTNSNAPAQVAAHSAQPGADNNTLGPSEGSGATQNPEDTVRYDAAKPADYDSTSNGSTQVLRTGGLEDLRTHIRRNSSQLEDFSRDRVEMLMLATRILMDERITAELKLDEPTLKAQLQRDSMMLNDLLAYLRGSQHPEMEQFIQPFHGIVSRVRAGKGPKTTAGTASNVSPPASAPANHPPAPGGD